MHLDKSLKAVKLQNKNVTYITNRCCSVAIEVAGQGEKVNIKKREGKQKGESEQINEGISLKEP